MKIAKRTLSIVLACIMAFGVFLVASSAEPAGADYSLVNAAITAKLPSADNRFFYTDEAQALIDDVLNNLINRNLTAADQAIVDGYVAMIDDLKVLLKTEMTAPLTSQLTFNYGNGYSFSPVYPYGATELSFYPFRAEGKAVNTLTLSADKVSVPAVSTVAGDQNFTVTISISSNALNYMGGIPVLFDKTKLELVGVDNAGTDVLFTPSELGTNYAEKYIFAGTLNPSVAAYWPAIYKDDAVFKSKWAGINIKMSADFTIATPGCVLPIAQEQIISLEFKVKTGAASGDAVVYIDSNFNVDVANRLNSLFFGRAKDANTLSQYDVLASYGATINVAAATATVKIAEPDMIGDVNFSGSVTVTDALWVLQAASGARVFTAREKLVADVTGEGNITITDALRILQFASGAIIHF